MALDVAARLIQNAAMPAGLARHQHLVGTFIRAAGLVQSCADAEFHHIGADEWSNGQERGNSVLLALAQAVTASWDSGFQAPLNVPEGLAAVLRSIVPPGPVTTKQAEGYAFYALYPESYAEAARASGLGPDTLVIGIRSIGTGLAAMVAAALGAGPAVTVRPTGHPFDRKLCLGAGLCQRLVEHFGPFAIVDEGPGLSGSSFNSVADWLVEQGVGEERLQFFPSHAGDLGSAAQDSHRQRWARASKHVAAFEPLILQGANPVHRLENWIADLVGPLEQPLRDVSGGAWREAMSQVPADPAMERRKFLCVGAQDRWLAKFEGVGQSGEDKLRLAYTLADAGFAPRPAGLCHGFLVMPWVQDIAAPGELVPLGRVVDYLALRAALPPLGSGAGLDALFDMAQYNIGQRCGVAAAERVGEALGDAARFTPVPCCTDNRLHPWEWIKTGEGWLKLDGLDHHASHDLVGCQDIAWDIAGAAIELDLTAVQRDEMVKRLSGTIGRRVDRDLVAALELCYLGFQIGLWTMALGRNGQTEQAPITALLERYTAHRALAGDHLR